MAAFGYGVYGELFGGERNMSVPRVVSGIQVQDVGEQEIVIETTLSVVDAARMSVNETGKVFSLQGIEWDTNTGKAVLRFKPNNGFVLVVDE